MAKVEIAAIQSPDQDLLIKAINTFPAEFTNGYINLIANGIEDPHPPYIAGELSRYVDSCLQFGVMPFTRVHLGYDWEKGVITPNDLGENSEFTYPRELNHQTHSHVLESLFGGGKIYEFAIGFPYYGNHNQQGFNAFRDNVIPALLNQEYQVGSFGLSVPSYHPFENAVERIVDRTQDRLALFETTEDKKNPVILAKLQEWFASLR